MTTSHPNDALYWLALNRAPRSNTRVLLKLLAHFTKIEEIFSLTKSQLADLGLKENLITYLTNPDWKLCEKDLKWAEQNQCHLITLHDDRYPTLLKEIPDPPLLLYVQGNTELLAQPQIAIVGSRNPSPTGLEITTLFSQQLCAAGLIITSGLALGIDGAAHNASLANQGKTIAVLGCGLNKIYPRRHQSLAKTINHQGALISEYPPDTNPAQFHFPERNRIVSGLSLGVLVVEASQRSGSLITARLAAEQGREVFAIPGSIRNPLSRGCHFLIKQGAKLVEAVSDILEDLPVAFNCSKPEKSYARSIAGLDESLQNLLKCVGFEPTTIDTIIYRSGLAVANVTSSLPLLEIKGLIAAVPSGYMRVK